MGKKPDLVIPAEPVLFPMWDLNNAHEQGVISAEVPFRDGYVRIENHNPDYPGLPKESDWKVYITLQRWVNEERKKTKEFPKELTFTLTRLKESLQQQEGGGQQNRNLINSIFRLRHTNVLTNVHIDKNKRRLESFNLLSAVRVDQSTGEFVITVGFPPEFILKEYYTKDNKPIISLETRYLDLISSPLGELVYARLQKHIIASGKGNSQFTRTYTFLLKEIFTGYVRRQYKSEIHRQIEKPLNELKQAGILYDWVLYQGSKESSLIQGQPETTKKRKAEKEFRVDFILKPPHLDKIEAQRKERKKKYAEENSRFKKLWESLPKQKQTELEQTAIQNVERKTTITQNQGPVFKAYLKQELKTLLDFPTRKD